MMAIGAYYMEGIFIVNHLQRGLVPRAGAHWAEQQIQGAEPLGTCDDARVGDRVGRAREKVGETHRLPQRRMEHMEA